MTERQQVLYLWLDGGSLDQRVVGWAFHDGAEGRGPQPPGSGGTGEAPYESGLAALCDGWMLLQSAQLVPPASGQEHINSYLEYEFVFERRCEIETESETESEKEADR